MQAIERSTNPSSEDQLVLQSLRSINPDSPITDIAQWEERLDEIFGRRVKVTPIAELSQKVARPRIIVSLRQRAGLALMSVLTISTVLLSACGKQNEVSAGLTTPQVAHTISYERDTSPSEVAVVSSSDFEDPDPDRTHINGGYIASIKGKVAAYMAEYYYGIVNFDPHQDAVRFAEEFDKDTLGQARLEAGIKLFFEINRVERFTLEGDDTWIRFKNRNSLKKVDLDTLSPEGWKNFLAGIGRHEERITVEANTEVAGATAVPPRLAQTYNAEAPNSFVCPSIGSEAQFLIQSKSGCLNESLGKVNFDVNRLNETNLYRGDTTDRDLANAAAKFGIPVEALRAALPLNRQGEMYVAFVDKDGQKKIGSVFFNFTEGNRFDLRSPNKTLPRTAKLTFVYQDGKIALVLDLCGNLIPGQEIPKALETPTPTPAPTRTPIPPTAPATPTETKILPTPTVTGTPIPPTPTPTAVPPSPTHEVPTPTLTPTPTSTPTPTPTVTARYEACVFGNIIRDLDPSGLYNLAYSHGFRGSSLDIIGMQRFLFDRTCRELPPPPPPVFLVCIDNNFITADIFTLYRLAVERGYAGSIDIQRIVEFLTRTCRILTATPFVVISPTPAPTNIGGIPTATRGATATVFPSATRGPGELKSPTPAR